MPLLITPASWLFLTLLLVAGGMYLTSRILLFLTAKRRIPNDERDAGDATLRQFRARCKSAAAFKWQTAPDTELKLEDFDSFEAWTRALVASEIDRRSPGRFGGYT